MGKRAETREFIIRKAAPVFNRRGFSGTSLEDLILATGLSRGSIYGNFQDKQEVARRALSFSIRQRKKGILAEMRIAGKSPLERLRAYPRYFRRNTRTIEEFGGCPLVNTSVDADDTNPELAVLVKGTVRDWRTALVDLLREGVEQGELQAGLDAPRLASLMITIIEGGLWHAKTSGNRKDLNYALDHFSEILEGLVLRA